MKNFENENIQLVFPKVSCMGSSHDRACEIFAFIKGRVVDYGKKHSKTFDHSRFGEDFSKKGCFPEWSSKNPVHLIGHSFGGNTARMLAYLLSIDQFESNTDSHWVKSISTISSPLQGSLLTYVLGANESQVDPNISPVRKFSVGYALGILAHLYAVVTDNGRYLKLLGIDFDVGLSHFNVANDGLKGFFKSLIGGKNGGGTPCVCSRDNAAHDMTVTQSRFYNSLFKTHVDTSRLYEFHFVATSSVTKNYSIKSTYRKHFQNSNISNSYATILCLRDTLTYRLAVGLRQRYSENRLNNYTFDDSSEEELECHLGDSDGLCSAFTQSVSRNINEDEESKEEDFLLKYNTEKFNLIDFSPGTYRIEMKEHTHFSIVPYPDDFSKQTEFFKTLFSVIQKL